MEQKKITKPIKYTKQFIFAEIPAILEEIENNKSIIYLGEVFEKKAYSFRRFSEWGKKYEDSKKISDTIAKIKEILESRINVRALKGNLNVTMAVFNLKNNYNWVDKKQFEHSGGFVTDLIKQANGNNKPANRKSPKQDKK